MGMNEAIKLFFSNYIKFDGRSRRAEFWWPALMNLIISWTLSGVAILVSGGFGAYAALQFSALGWIFYGASVLWGLAVFIPGLSVAVRRLHDRNMTGWFLLGFVVAIIIPLLNIVAIIAFIVVLAMPGTVGPNKFGADPKGGHDVGVFS